MVICFKCKIVKLDDDFTPSQLKNSSKMCKLCCSENSKNHYMNNKEKVDKKQKIYRDNNKEKISDYHKNNYIKNKNKIDKQHKDYYNNNKEKTQKRHKINRIKNKQKDIERRRIYNEINKEKLKNKWHDYYIKNKINISNYGKFYRSINENKIKRNKTASIYSKKRKLNDPSYKLRKEVSSLIYIMIKSQNGSKSGNSILNFLPYTIEELCNHIESQFESWMNWDNHGNYRVKDWDDNDSTTWKWQLDHIIPQSKLAFNSMNHDNFLKCWDLKNIRPLSAKQNVLDNNRR